MKYNYYLLPILLVTLFSCNQSAKNNPEKVVDLFVESVNKKDLSPLNEVFSNDAKIYEQGSVDESWEKYRDGHLGEEIKAIDDLNFSISTEEIFETSAMTLVRGKYSLSGIMNGNPITSEGLTTLIIKVEGNTWKIVHLQFSRGCSKPKNEAHSHAEEKKKPLSPPAETVSQIGNVEVKINYSSPRVRDRQIFGGLVGYDKVWAAGAHRATTIEFSSDVTVNGVNVPAGKYGFFTIPGKDKWTLIINETWDQHMADDYNSDNDVVRIEASPEKLDETQEELLYSVEKIDNTTGEISLAWAKTKVAFTFSTN